MKSCNKLFFFIQIHEETVEILVFLQMILPLDIFGASDCCFFFLRLCVFTYQVYEKTCLYMECLIFLVEWILGQLQDGSFAAQSSSSATPHAENTRFGDLYMQTESSYHHFWKLYVMRSKYVLYQPKENHGPTVNNLK